MGDINMKEDPIQYAKNMAIKSIDDTEEIRLAIQDLTDSYKYQIDKLKGIIKEYFSDLQSDETNVGSMRRLQIRKELLEFANK